MNAEKEVPFGADRNNHPGATTPSGVRVVAHLPDGSEINVTEGVQVLYDTVIGSMDWGSGFLSAEDAQPIVQVARTCGFTGWEAAQRYVTEQQHSDEQLRFLNERHVAGLPSAWNIPHDHVYSTAGKCMWPRCEAAESERS